MCYEESFFRPWAARKDQKRERNQPVTGRERPQPEPVSSEGAGEAKPRKETERELEEIV